MALRVGNDIWDRAPTGAEVMSKHLFAALVAFWTGIGIAGSAIMAHLARDWQPGVIEFLGLFAITIVGVIIAVKSDEPIVSLVGYALIALPFGALAGPLVAMYSAASVSKVFFITTGVVAVLGIVGAAIPDNLEGWGSYLLGALLVLLLGSFLVPIAGLFGVPIGGALTLLDWAGVVIFSGYVIFDWNRAMHVERTHDNAIDCAVAVYLDFANLFIRLLSLWGDD